ncbi:hypothetical protein JS520_00685 [Candidatus Vidania fulgoroideae]|nr:hypothetical protein JS520_00685 [Candidatus Vidania fulgoroideae]
MKLRLYRVTTTKRINCENVTAIKNFITNRSLTKQQLKHYFKNITKINTLKYKGKKLIILQFKK